MAPINEPGTVAAVIEVVRLQKDAMAEGEIFRREFAFMSDGSVFTRVSNQQSESRGWVAVPKVWTGRTALETLVANQKAKGWTAIWHPAHDPALQEFTRFVPAEGLLGPEGPSSFS
jgi:hypothetical protein